MQGIHHIPRWINQARYRWRNGKKSSSQNPAIVDYDPWHLVVFTEACCKQNCSQCVGTLRQVLDGQSGLMCDSSPATMELELFQYVLDQWPSIQTIEFAGPGEPFMARDLFAMINYAAETLELPGTVTTNGLMLDERLEELIQSKCHTVVVRLVGHKPSTFRALTGLPAEQFAAILANVKAMMRARLPETFQVKLQFVIDTETVCLIPEIIAFAEDLNADGIIFEPFFDHAEYVATRQRSLRTLSSDNDMVMAELERAIRKHYRIPIEWPGLSGHKPDENRHCQDAFSVLGVNAQGYLTPCSKRRLLQGRMGTLWEPGFWNSDLVQWLRRVQSGSVPALMPSPVGETASVQAEKLALPLPCQHCEKNCAPHPLAVPPVADTRIISFNPAFKRA